MKATVLRTTAILAVAMALTAISAHAQGTPERQTYVVPFEFSVGKRVLPAGEYTVSNRTPIIKVESKDGKHTAYTLPSATLGTGKRYAQAKLTFHRVGEQYSLSQVWWSDGMGRQLKPKQQPQSEVAQNVSTVDIVAGNR
jgi:hypothetical protein